MAQIPSSCSKAIIAFYILAASSITQSTVNVHFFVDFARKFSLNSIVVIADLNSGKPIMIIPADNWQACFSGMVDSREGRYLLKELSHQLRNTSFFNYPGPMWAWWYWSSLKEIQNDYVYGLKNKTPLYHCVFILVLKNGQALWEDSWKLCYHLQFQNGDRAIL